MRFQRGIGYPGPRKPRGRARHDPPYRMSRAAYQARLRSLGGVQGRRNSMESKRIEAEIALATFHPEPYRALARRLGLRSHAYCWRTARRYRRGLIPMLPPDEGGLLRLLDMLAPTQEAAPKQLRSGVCPKCGGVLFTADRDLYAKQCTCHAHNCPCAACRMARGIEEALRELRRSPQHA